MVSDDEIVAAAHRMLTRINSGEASLYKAGEDFARELLESARSRNMLEPFACSEEEASGHAVPGT